MTVELEVENDGEIHEKDLQGNDAPRDCHATHHAPDSITTQKDATLSSTSGPAELPRLIPDAADTKAHDPESGEWPDAEENRKSHSNSPFREASARVHALSLKDELSGRTLDSPSSKPNTGSAKGKKRAPPLRKFDPDQ